MIDLTTPVFKSVGRHFVSLSCVECVPGSQERLALVFSGFLVEVEAVWFFITAGHVIKQIREAMESGAQFDMWRLDDQTAGKHFREGGAAIPYDFKLDEWLEIEDEQEGIDYAATPICGLYRMQLEAGGAIPVRSDAWRYHDPTTRYWAMIGMPHEKVLYDNVSVISASIVIVPLIPTTPPEAATHKGANLFYARLADDAIHVVRSVEGMSGGPIFAIEKLDGEWKYWVIGVQSRWFPNSRVIGACPFASFAAELKAIVRVARAKVGLDS